MQTIGQILRARRRELGLTLEALAEAVGCTKGYLSLIENDKREHPPSEGLLRALEGALRLSPGRLVDLGSWQATPAPMKRRVQDLEFGQQAARRLAGLLREGGIDRLHESGELRRLVDHISPEPSDPARSRSAGIASMLPVQVPLINRLAAGYHAEFTDLDYPARVADEYIAVPDVYDADAFAARVVGDSMEPSYLEGDIVVFSPSSETPPGTDCFIRLEPDSETTFKRVYFEVGAGGESMIRLQPLNSEYGPRIIPREQVAGMYAAVYVVRPVQRIGGAGS